MVIKVIGTFDRRSFTGNGHCSAFSRIERKLPGLSPGEKFVNVSPQRNAVNRRVDTTIEDTVISVKTEGECYE